MNYFGLRSIDDLPQLKEFQMASEEIGEPAALEEMVTYDIPENGNPNPDVMNDDSEE